MSRGAESDNGHVSVQKLRKLCKRAQFPSRHRLFAQNVLLQASQNVKVVLRVNSLTLGVEFTVHSPVSVKKNHQHLLALDVMCLLQS